MNLRPYRRRFDRDAARAPLQVKLQVDEFVRAVGVDFRAHAGKTVAQAALQRANALPFEAIERVAGRMRLRDGRASEPPAPIVVVAVRAGEVELALPAQEGGTSGLEKRLRRAIGRGRGRHPARLPPDVRLERQKLLADG